MMDAKAIIDVLEEFVSDNKLAHIERVLNHRTRHLTLVFEDIDKPHNVSAVLRTAECMGIQDLHFIKNKNEYSVNTGITQGAAKWVTLHQHDQSADNISECFDSLRKCGYKVYATSLHETSCSIHDIDPQQKAAIVFGTEADGITPEAGEKADGFVHIPMVGFTESFNLSVSASICLTVLKSKLGEWPKLSEGEKLDLRAQWYRKIVREADLILKTKGVVYE
ncbi:TrmH family RNA methyltransferase [Ekhidna sp. To15]|uniref:TrmH family RNA methyltransferase n=1 Tax=Ekhidna sp. To15 TaxID=3395267 RepID=UPI003F525A87